MPPSFPFPWPLIGVCRAFEKTWYPRQAVRASEHPPTSTTCHSKSPNHLSALGAKRGKSKKITRNKKNNIHITKWASAFVSVVRSTERRLAHKTEVACFDDDQPARLIAGNQIQMVWSGVEWSGWGWSVGDLRKLDTRKNAPKWLFNWVVKLSDGGCQTPTPTPIPTTTTTPIRPFSGMANACAIIEFYDWHDNFAF